MKIEIIKEIDKTTASNFVAKHHYRKTMPRLNKVFYGGFYSGELVGIVTLGYGTQPVVTIKKMFPLLSTADYYEVGRLCLLDELPRNSESNFLSRVFEIVKKNNSKIKVIFSWSDGIMGKPGFVYQATNFMYAGKIKTDVYITQEGYLIHPRSAKKLLEANAFFENKEKLFWLTRSFARKNNIIRLKGFQFRYVYFLCNKREKRDLIKTSPVSINLDYPKTKDIFFFKENSVGKYAPCDFPKYKETLNAEEVSKAIHIDSINEGLVRFQHSAPVMKDINP